MLVAIVFALFVGHYQNFMASPSRVIHAAPLSTQASENEELERLAQRLAASWGITLSNIVRDARTISLSTPMCCPRNRSERFVQKHPNAFIELNEPVIRLDPLLAEPAELGDDAVGDTAAS
ncbi:hypothetical protein AS156_06125 [Bradyrhizobium macuxiense]|uniref:Uncharacterized protein n=1 Tax=Bradyrhizobium macuxiense TaxID=1755647 RepID=A0A109JU91_9BRAD|nr:hypothetical protein [Bradyrhizobium macuxiense]KWV55238.1 hypothetical protein AS156_06125 [Bradyrhizobium macuxiense]